MHIQQWWYKDTSVVLTIERMFWSFIIGSKPAVDFNDFHPLNNYNPCWACPVFLFWQRWFHDTSGRGWACDGDQTWASFWHLSPADTVRNCKYILFYPPAAITWLIHHTGREMNVLSFHFGPSIYFAACGNEYTFRYKPVANLCSWIFP